MELIHTCYRIGDIDRSVAFYCALGFEEGGSRICFVRDPDSC
jgi:catechol 2,3-dioxygenase-like lactoylglutathione lyase family enzyme